MISSGIPGGIDPTKLTALTDRARFPLSDAGNAAAFAWLFGDRARFIHDGSTASSSRGAWFLWDGVRWKIDDTRQVHRLAQELWRAWAAVVSFNPNAEVIKWAAQTQSAYRINAMLDLASSHDPIAAPSGIFDQDPYLFGVRNGVVDLRTGTVRPGQPSDNISLQSGVAFDASATAPTWDQFLKDVFHGDQEVISFVRRLVGWSLTGVAADHFVVSWGPGRNGKSTFNNVVEALLGDYAGQAQVSTFTPHRSESPRNDLARLFGKRFVAATEKSSEWTLDEGTVKQITGGDRLVARFLYREHREAVPTFKVWIAVNHMPRIKDTTIAMWERLFVLPFTAMFIGAKADLNIGDKLTAELPGILNFAIRGCLDWRAIGFSPPSKVVAATQAYRAESDVIERFLADECVLGNAGTVKAAILYGRFKDWCKQEGEDTPTQTAFGLTLKEKGFAKNRISGHVVYTNIAVRIKT